ncbi:non-ribosomal peptide synthetase [Nocardiopsis sp. JB363]|uniref:non-ribosomal peptide synthetase n=1 Tax=Nocardiopsis sp. JB363 TaxID=1434837 RepID=UPI00097A7B4D|nr:non-ribosomal peptide synthetase [Nocardiopsis sp. JB363]SIO90369.1 putative non-ribosomal peptide synthetase [Nocardiopsis sp. JB363]
MRTPTHLDHRSEPSTPWEDFARVALRAPDRVAVVDSRGGTTYGELLTAAETLAAWLPHRAGGTRVAVRLPRSSHLVTAMLAALRVGVYLPVPPQVPDERVRTIYAQAPPDVVIADDDPCLPVGVPLIVPGSAGDDRHLAHPLPCPDDLAYVVFTSGTSGEPKGVEVEQGALAGHLRVVADRFAYGERDRVLLFASPSADVHIEQALAPLVRGAAVVVREHEPVPDPQEFLDLLRGERVTVANLPAGYWRRLADVEAPPSRIPDLRLMVVGSDVMPTEHARSWLTGVGAEAELANAYGPTETVITASTHGVSTDEASSGDSSVPLGTALGERTLHVLDESMRPVTRPGAIGELCVSGLLARGYANAPGRTAERFVPSPFAHGGRLYRTGDRVRLTERGEPVFLGRGDRQVKVNGFRVEPAEIEALVVQVPGVADCAVVDLGADTPHRLALLVAPAAFDRVRPKDVRDALGARLDQALLPGRIHVVDALPVTDRGVFDHDGARRLVTRSTEEVGTDPSDTDDLTELERSLLDVWREAFENDGIGPDQDFVGQGGDSMTSLAIAMRLPALGLRARPRDIFEARTVRGLAAWLWNGAEGGDDAGTVDSVGSGDVSPGVHWLVDRVGRIPKVWNQYVLIDLDPLTRVDLLRQAFSAVVRRHTALTSDVVVRDGRARSGGSRETGPGPWSTLVEDGAEGSDDVERRAVRITDEAIDPSRGRMIHAVLVQGPGDDLRILVGAHHTAVDMVSWRLLLGELDNTYGLLGAGWALSASEDAASVHAWSGAVRRAVLNGDFDQELDHWRGTARSAATVEDVDTGVEGDAVTATTRVSGLGSVDTGRQVSESLSRLLLTAAVTEWKQWSAPGPCLVEFEGTGRETIDDAAAYETVGWLTCMYPLVVPEGPVDGVREQVRSLLQDSPGTGGGYGALRSHHPDPDVRESLRIGVRPHLGVNFLGRVGLPEHSALMADKGEARAGTSRAPQTPRPCAWMVEGWVSGDDVVVTVEFDGRRMDPAEARRVVDAIAVRLGDLLREGEEERFPLMPAQEGMLFHTLSDRTGQSYVAQLAVTLDGPLDEKAFAAAWHRAARAHPALRTTFSWQSARGPEQIIVPEAGIEVTLGERGPDGDHEDDTIEKVLATERSRGFDLRSAPLLRVLLTPVGERRLCVVTHHHIILDGWSMNLLLDDVMSAYAGMVSGVGGELRTRPSIARAASQRRSDGEGRRFWRESLAGARPSLMVTEAARNGSHEETSNRIDGDAWTSLATRARSVGLTPAALVHTGWGLLLATELGVSDVVFGTVLSGRDSSSPDVERMSGMLINTLPIRLLVPPERLLADVREDVSRYLRGLQEHQHSPPSTLRKAAGLAPSARLFDTVLDFGDRRTMLGRRDADVAGVRVRYAGSSERTNYGVTISAFAGTTGLDISLNHDVGVLPKESAHDLIGHYRACLERVAETGGLTVADVVRSIRGKGRT